MVFIKRDSEVVRKMNTKLQFIMYVHSFWRKMPGFDVGLQYRNSYRLFCITAPCKWVFIVVFDSNILNTLCLLSVQPAGSRSVCTARFEKFTLHGTMFRHFARMLWNRYSLFWHLQNALSEKYINLKITVISVQLYLHNSAPHSFKF